MKITNIGGATAIVEHNGKRILFDPWLNEGVLHGSWYHFPPLTLGLEELGHLDYVYISHIHEDHCAPGTLARINRDAEIIIMDREPQVPNFIAKFLTNYGFQFRKVHRIRPKTPVEIEPGLVVDMVEGDPRHEYSYLIDSGLILKWDGQVLYNSNDCEPYPDAIEYIRHQYGQPDLSLLPYCAGSGYPACFAQLTDEQKASERDRIINGALRLFVDTARSLDSKRVMPFADQYVIGGSRFHLNKYAAHPPCPGACLEPMRAAGLQDRLLLLNPGQTFDLSTASKSPKQPYRHWTEDERMEHAQALASYPYDHERITFSKSVPIQRLLASARQRMWEVQQRQGYFPACYLYLDVPDRQMRFEINLKIPQVSEVELDGDNSLRQPHLRITAPSTLLTMMLINHVSWNMADGARFLDYDRRPDIYDPKFNAFLNHLII